MSGLKVVRRLVSLARRLHRVPLPAPGGPGWGDDMVSDRGSLGLFGCLCGYQTYPVL